MASLHYLTVQDILWINLQITKKVQPFNYATLEEAVFYQYAYGESNTLFPQAARFVTGFAKMNPFEAGNEATAFVAFIAFLKINGYIVNTTPEEAGKWFSQATASSVGEFVTEDPEASHALVPDVRNAVSGILATYSEQISGLYSGNVAA